MTRRVQERLLRDFVERHPSEAASLLAEQTGDEAASVLSALPDAAAAQVLGRVPSPIAARMLARLAPDRARHLAGRLSLEQAASLLRHLEPEARENLLTALPSADHLRSLIAYPRGTAGALMDPSVPALPAGLELDAVRRQLGEVSPHLALDLYAVGENQRLAGVVDLRHVLDPSRRGPFGALARPVEPLRELADLGAMTAHPGWRHHETLPVVDERGTYLGAVRAERLRQIAHEAATRRSRGGADAVLALGELFWLGVTGVFSSLAGAQDEEEAR
jgi:Mg/Co/Ni transporter MgtE